MDFISSKNIFLLTRDTLKLIQRDIMKHGSRTGYIFYMMLRERGGYEKFELAEWTMLATLHDIGAYKTNRADELVQFELKDVMPHSVYGYLFLKHLSPMSDKSKVLLYHHLDFSKIKDSQFIYEKETEFLSLAEKVDIYRETLGDKFQLSMLEKYRDVKFSSEAIDCLYTIEEKYHIFANIDSEEFEKELDTLMDFIMFTNEEKKQYMEMLMYCIGLRAQSKVIDSVTTICICEELAKRMGMDAKSSEELYYGALLHDLGMLAISSKIIDSERALTKEEVELMRTHVEIAERILANRMNESVVKIISAHHERLDGSGYPKKLSSNDMNVDMRILQIADTVTALVNERSYKKSLEKKDVVEILEEEKRLNHFDSQVVDYMISSFDEILQKVKAKSEDILKINFQMEKQFEIVCKKYGIS